MLFYAAAGMKCSSQHFIPHSCWEPWKIMRKITIRLQADLSMACMCKGKNSLCILEARGLIKIKAFWKQDTYILRVQSWEIMRLSQFKNLHPVHCLKPNMEAGIRTQNHMHQGETTQHIWIIKRWQWKCQECFDLSEIQNAFPLISLLKNRTSHFKRQLPPWLPANKCLQLQTIYEFNYPFILKPRNITLLQSTLMQYLVLLRHFLWHFH